MPQQLRVLSDPSIVAPVPTTNLEQLQLATERKAAQMARERQQAGSDSGLTTRTVSTVAIDPYSGQPITTGGSATPATRAALTRQQQDAFRETQGAGAYVASPAGQPARSVVYGKDNSRLDTGDPILSYAPGSAAAAAAADLAGRQSFPLQGGGSLTGSGVPNYAGYRATMRLANPNPLIPGPTYVPQPVTGDPWENLRMPGEVPVVMDGYVLGNGPKGAAPGQGLFSPSPVTIAPATLAAMRASADYVPEQIKALEQGKGMYAAAPGQYMPTMAPGGKPRRTSGDSSSSSPTGSGGSLVGR